MATTRLAPQIKSDYDHIFFQAFAALVVVVVFVGFAQTFYLSGVLQVPRWKAFAAPPHHWIVNVHGIVFSAWAILLLAQTSLATAGRIDLHRRLGLAGFALACLVVLAGVAVVCEQTARVYRPGHSIVFVTAQIFRVVGFAALSYFGFRQRRNPRAHKRLMLLATIVLLPAPLARWPIFIGGNFILTLACCYSLLALMALYDWRSTGKVQLATLLGSATVIATNPPIIVAFTHNAVWVYVSTHMLALGRLLR
jgi:hypothetical protein